MDIQTATLWVFAKRTVIGVRYRGWQVDYMPGRWRVFTDRRGIAEPGAGHFDVGRLGIFRWGRVR